MAATADTLKAPPTPKDRHGPAFLEDLPIGSIVLAKNVRELRPEDVEELARSIEQVGVLNPVDVSMGKPGTPGDLKYTLVAGHRRVAAAKIAKLRTIPARVFELTPEEVVEFQLTENLQRKDLSELEEARAFKDYVDAGHSQADLAEKIGKSGPYVSNRIRLLGLPDPIVKNLEAGKLSPSHAEVFLQLPKEATAHEVGELLQRTTRDGESVRQLAERVNWKAGTIRDRTKRKNEWAALLAKAKFPVCPIDGCGGKPQQLMGYGQAGTFSDRAGHTWNQRTGAVTKKQTQRAPRRDAPPPEPTLPIAPDHVECPVPAAQLWYVLDTPGSKIASFRVSPRGRKGIEVDLRIISDRTHPRNLPGFWFDGKDGFVHVEGTADYHQRTDADRKRAAAGNEVLAEWLKAMAKKAESPSKKAKK